MSDFKELIANLPIDQIAANLGVSKRKANAAVGAAVPALLKGMQANAADPAGAASLTSAVESKDTSLVDGRISLADVDTEDGNKIVANIFGDNQSDVASKLSGLGGLDAGGIQKLLGMLGPIVLAWLAKKKISDATSGGGIGDLLGGLLGGGSGGSSSKKKSSGGLGGLGGLLGGLFGGGKSSGGGLDDLLGGLLGGGKR